ncbi:MAG: DUF86 domain-containing protein [Deltaproteobacteria bacterium]|nr:DUF86 domain-containing protein [Deltaproteobacteria bacterium]
MVDRDVLREKCATVEASVRRLRLRTPATVEGLEGDVDAQESVRLNLQVAIQACIDLAAHVVADEGYELAPEPAATFAVLAREGIIPAELSVRLASAAGLRNILVHRYGQLEMARIHDAAVAGIADLIEFCRVVRERFG